MAIISKYWKSIIIFVAIFILSVVNFSAVENVPKFKYSDKIVHALMYSVLTFVLFYDFKSVNQYKIRSKYIFLILCSIPILYGGFIEFVQHFFFPPRQAEWLDWFADIFGTILGALPAFIFFFKQK